MPQSRSVEVIVNIRSGLQQEDDLPERLDELFKKAGVEARITAAQHGGEIAHLARIASKRAELIVAGGGDGTVNTVASAVLANDKTLGVLPLGTFNHFARDLNIPIDLESAVQTTVSGLIARIDVGKVNDRIFLNNSSLGLYPNIVRERQKQQRLGYGKWRAFAWAAITVLRRYPFLDVSLKAAGKEIQSRTPFVFIGNNEYAMEGFNIGARKSLDAGVLSMYVTLRTGRWGLFRLALRALLGRLKDEKDFLSLITDQALIKTRRKHLGIACDGEVAIMEAPLHYRIVSGALRVMVPPRQEV